GLSADRQSVTHLSVRRPGLSDLAPVQVRMPEVSKPIKCSLHLSLTTTDAAIENEWPVWIFPPASQLVSAVLYDPVAAMKSFPAARIASPRDAPAKAVLVTTVLDESMLSHLDQGGRVLLLSRESRTHLPERITGADDPNVPYPLDFAPTFWGGGGAPGGGNLGTVIANHPALGDFPHEGFCDLQFLSLLRGVGRADLDALPTRITPIIRSITDWRLGASAAYLYEVNVGRGKLMVTTLNFER